MMEGLYMQGLVRCAGASYCPLSSRLKFQCRPPLKSWLLQLKAIVLKPQRQPSAAQSSNKDSPSSACQPPWAARAWRPSHNAARGARRGGRRMEVEARRVLAAGGDRFDQLGVVRGAPFPDIKRRYKKLAFALHPDKNPDSQLAAEAFAIVSAAFSELSALAASAAAAAAPLQSSQHEAAPQGSNRWQAFTGGQGHKQPAAPPAQQGQQQHGQQQHEQSGGSSQENRTPSSQQGAGCGGAWQAVSKWGKPGSANLLRAQPVAGPPAPPPVASTHKPLPQQQQPPAAKGGRRASPSSSSSGDGSSDSSSGEEEDGDFVQPSNRPSGGGVKPSAFYGGSRRGSSPVASAAAGPPSSLYGLFGGRHRIPTAAGGGWLAAGTQSQPPVQWVEQRAQSQPAVQPVVQAAQGGGSRWGAPKGKLALLHQPPVAGPGMALGVATAGGNGSQPAAADQQQQQRGSARPAKRQQGEVATSSSSDSSDSEDSEWDDAGEEGWDLRGQQQLRCFCPGCPLLRLNWPV